MVDIFCRTYTIVRFVLVDKKTRNCEPLSTDLNFMQSNWLQYCPLKHC